MDARRIRMTPYVELQVLTHFSLCGASSREELFSAAALLGYPAIGVSDPGTVAGVVRAWVAQKATGVRSIPCTRLLMAGKTRAGKGACHPVTAGYV